MNVCIKNLTKIYKPNVYALKDCSLDIKQGEFLVIMGSSGSGKSTLLKVLAGIERHNAGSIFFDGISAENIPLKDRNTALVFQEYVLYPNKTVYENILYGVKYRGVSAEQAERRAKQALQLFNLTDAWDQLPKNLSGGQQQRTALAKAFVRQSDLVLMDEPMSNVAQDARKTYCNHLAELKRQLPNSTFVYVTHSLAEALLLGDRIAVMENGKIVGVVKKNLLRGYAIGDDATQLFANPLFANTFCLPCSLDDQTFSVLDQTFPLGSLASRLMSLPQQAQMQIDVSKLSKTPLLGGIPLVFEVLNNGGSHVMLGAGDQTFCLPRKTNLQAGQKIKMYYNVADIVLLDEQGKRITSNLPLDGNVFPVKVLSATDGTFALMGKKYKVPYAIPQGASCIFVPYTAVSLALGSEPCVIRANACIQEDYFENFKIGYFAVDGLATPMSARLMPFVHPLVGKNHRLALDLTALQFVG